MSKVASPFASLPEPPYYIVSFSSRRMTGDDGYYAMGDAMMRLAREQPGCLGVESVRNADGFGITNSYWVDEDSIRAWKNVVDHLAAQRRGRRDWYAHFEVRVGQITRAYGFIRPRQ